MLDALDLAAYRKCTSIDSQENCVRIEEEKFVEVEDKVEYISKVEKEDESFNIFEAEHSDGAFVSNILSAHNILPNNGNSEYEFPGLYKNFGIVFWFGNVYSGLDNGI